MRSLFHKYPKLFSLFGPFLKNSYCKSEQNNVKIEYGEKCTLFLNCLVIFTRATEFSGTALRQYTGPSMAVASWHVYWMRCLYEDERNS